MPLVLVENGGRKGEQFVLSGTSSFCVGRDQAAEICLPDPMVSRRHFTLEVQNGAYLLRDLGSANGTQVNGRRVQETRLLKAGDRIQAGGTLLTFLGEQAA